MVTTRPPKTIVKPTALGPVANTDTKLLIYGLFQKGRVLAQDGVPFFFHEPRDTSAALRWLDFSMRMIDELGDGPGAGLRVRLYFWTRRDCKTALQY